MPQARRAPHSMRAHRAPAAPRRTPRLASCRTSRRTSNSNQLPADRLAAAQRHDGHVAGQHFGGQRPLFAAQRDLLGAARQAVEVRTEEAREAFELVERARVVERFGVELERVQRRVATRAAAGVFLQALRVRRAVGAEEEARVARRGRLDQRHAMRLALEDRQTVIVRTDAALENRVAVVEQMVRRDRRAEQAGRGVIGADVIDGVLRRDVLEHHLQAREVAAQRRHHAVDEDLLAIEQVDVGARHLTVHEQRHAHFLHRFERLRALADVGHARVRICGRARRIQLHAMHETARLRAANFLGRRVVGQVQRHQRLELQARGQRREDAVAIRGSQLGRRDRRLEVRHDDRAAELARRVRQDRRQHRAVAHVKVPVVGAGKREGRGGRCVHGVM
ncbi:hypothetical protein PT2222_160049 [Paraburkholderia tropica]